MFRRIFPITAIIVLALSGSALGQLTEFNLDSLRRVGEQEGWTFTIAENDATRRPLSELCGMVVPDKPEPAELMSSPTAVQAFPTSFDWRDYVDLPPIKNQGGCGSCWAFATVGTLECAVKIKDDLTVDLSEQWLVNCNQDGMGCGGGWWAHYYHLYDTNPMVRYDPCGNFGPVWESDYPYTGVDGACGCPYPHQYEHCIDYWGYVEGSSSVASVDGIKQAILLYGPVGVGVYVDNENVFQGYAGGVYNHCINDAGINHAVVLVGWCDELGTSGAWILRNSWGPGWGEEGYMYIEYGCSLVGYGAAYIDYGLPRVALWADTTYGPVPLDVNFDATTKLSSVTSWAWDFGDGGSAGVKDPSHTFNQRGAFDITVEVTAGGQVYPATRPMYIVAYADTLIGTDAIGSPGQTVVVTISAHNSAPVRYIRIPFEHPIGDFTLAYDSFNTDGCRTSYFEVQDYLHFDPWFNRNSTIKLVSSESDTSPELAPGEGPIVKLYFTMPGSATEGQTSPIYLDGYDTYIPEFQGSVLDYQIPAVDCQVTCAAACCQNRGDVDHSGVVDNADVVYIVEWAFSSGATPPCADEAEIDGVAGVNIDDLLYLVDYIYHGGPAPGACN